MRQDADITTAKANWRDFKRRKLLVVKARKVIWRTVYEVLNR